MEDTFGGGAAVISDSTNAEGVERVSAFDFAAFVSRCNELGCVTDEERAAKAGVSIRTYYRWQNGATPTLETLTETAKRLGIPTSGLMGGGR